MRSGADFPYVVPNGKHYRIIHSKYPAKNLFDEDDDFNYLLGELESMSSDRLVNYLDYVHKLDVRHGDGWGAVMASFCYPAAGRWSTDEAGAYYCADSVDCAIAEWAYHCAKFWGEFGYNQGWNEVSATVRCYTGTFESTLVDVRSADEFHLTDGKDIYAASQAFSLLLRDSSANGVYFRSARHSGGFCAALFRPPATSAVTQSAHYVCEYDGDRFTSYAKVGSFHPIR